MSHGYEPHLYQAVFHFLCNDTTQKLLRFRMLVAGRRGGKTLSAAWEVGYYCLHPEHFHWDAHRVHSAEPLHVWVLSPDHRNTGRAARRTFKKVLGEAGLSEGKDYKWNRGELYVEFENNSFLEFKTAEQADNLVGAGIDILWIDEAAVVPNEDAYEYASPALDDKLGIVVCTTTPRGKNWFYKEFWSGDAGGDENIGSVEYRSIDNPFFPREAWEYRKKRYHPMRFKQEFMAAFDAMAGKEFSADWLHYYELDDLPLKVPGIGVTREDGTLKIDNLDLDIFIGMDPAISMSERADYFAICVLGVRKDRSEAFVLEHWRGKLPFPEQVDLIQKYHLTWHPVFIGVEAQAYQAALPQQAMRLASMPPIIAQPAKGKKEERIITMTPSFRTGQVKIRDEVARDFIGEWLNYDPEMKNPEDDLLDATEIAIRTAGILLPGFDDQPETPYHEPSLDELAHSRLPGGTEHQGYDENMGADW